MPGNKEALHAIPVVLGIGHLVAEALHLIVRRKVLPR
jgi:hypothetical protein